MTAPKSIVDTIAERVVEVVLSGRSRVIVCAAHRISCEGWLKVESLRSLVEGFSTATGTDVRPERANVDLTVQSPSERVLIELKTFPTNYGRGGKPITNFVDGIIDDLTKLSRKRGEGIGLSVWMAYVIPDPTPPSWSSHLGKIQAVAARTRRVERIPLWDEKSLAHLYVMESR
jgi:hypothetical protein